MNEAAVSLSPGRPLAPMQRGLWMSQRLHPDAPVQNMALLTHIDGSVDAARLVTAFDRVVDEVDVLRTRFIDDRGTPLVRLDADRQEPTILSMTKAGAEDWARDRVKEPIDITVRGYDSVIIEHPDGTTSWYLSLHHTITDATSSAMIFAATAAAYHGEPFEAPSYYAWSRRFDADAADRGSETAPELKRQREAADFWRRRPSAPKIDRLYQPVRDPEPAAERLPVVMSDALVAELDERLAAEYRMLSPDLAWTALLMTVTATHLNQVAGAEHFSLGLPVHNRGDAESRSLIGPIMEVFPVDVSVEPATTFRSLHKQIGRSILRTLGQAAPGTAPPPDYAAVVNVIPRAAVGSFGTLATSTQWIHSGAIDSNHLLRVQLSAYQGPDPDAGAGRPAMALDLNHGGADADQRRRAPDHLVRILEAMVAEPDRSIAVPLPCGDELTAIESWETTDDFDGETIDVVSRLQAVLAERDTVALRDGEQTWTGAELWQRVEAVAALLRTSGVEPGTRVGIELARSSDAVIAILAVLVAGGSFVPLDVTLPARRRRALSSRADCHLVLSALPDREPVTDRSDAVETAAAPPAARPAPDQEAYLLFTSGSTGQPKGVPITHEGLARYLRFAVENYVDPRGPTPVVPLFSALSFDLTITSLFLPLLTGGEQVIIRPDGPAGLAAIANDSTLNWCKATPSHLEVLARLVPDGHQLRTLVVGGEAFGSGLARRLLELNPDLAIFNEYGPTEAVVGCMIHRVDPSQLELNREVPIGVPAPGVELRIVGPDLQRVPLGAAGQLCISHVGVTSGYLLDPAADNDNDNDPFVELDGSRFYRSGDLVRLVDPETLVYLGRIDEQVKVGGIRLEPTEVEEAIATHPAISRAAVRLWSPTKSEPDQRCTTCGLPSNVPGVVFDLSGVCSTCHDYERVAPQTTDWFRTPDDLRAKREDARSRRSGRYDCLHLLSGGKDSTYALYQLVEAGFEPYALTLDNGFISEGAKENVRRSIADLGIDHEFATSESMNAIFRDSLERHSNVCHGCYKTIYTLATTRADELGIPMIVTGLSRGQLFETRLIPQQFASGRFDPDAIDRAVVEARKTYHRLDDGPNRLLDTSVFAADEVFDRIEYLDFYRYVDVELAEMLDYLETKAPWVRPSDTGRSTNCLVNAAGIHTHLTEQGYHNYAIPYAWDVRLGHKTRDEAIEELDDQLDPVEVNEMLQTIGYTPKPVEVLTAWLEPVPGAAAPSPAELRSFLAESLPAHGIPAAFVTVDEIPMTTNGKLDAAALPAPERIHRTSTGIQVAAESELEATVIRIWERLLRIEPIGAEDDFFALGGDSLGALEMIVAVGDALGRPLGDELAFGHTTPRALAAAIELTIGSADETDAALETEAAGGPPLGPSPWSSANPPPLSPGEQSILFDQSLAPESVKYNVGRLYVVDGPLDTTAINTALRSLVEVNIPLSWTYGRTRRRLDPTEAIEFSVGTVPVAGERLDDHFRPAHRAPFDLENGPLLRVAVEPTDDGRTAVFLACHHVSGDAGSFDRLWTQLDDALSGRPITEPPIDYPSFTHWQQDQLTDGDRAHWKLDPRAPAAAGLVLDKGPTEEQDGFRTRAASISAAKLKRRVGTSGFALATTAVMATLRRYTSGDAVSLGLISSSRNHPAAEPLFGYFLNTLPLDLECPLDELLGPLTDRVATAIAANLAHRAYPFSRIVADRRADGVAPATTNVLLAYDELSTTTLQGRAVEQKVLSNGSAVTDLTLFVELRDEQVDLSLEYRGSLLGRAEADQLLDDVDAMLSAVVDDETTAVGVVELPSVSDSILFGPKLEAPPHVLDLITANADRVGIEEAVVCGDEAISWTELDQQSAALAGRLATDGVGPGDRVVVEMPRSVDLAIAILGVLRAGAAYVPVDPAYPAERRALIVERADAALTLVASTGQEHPDTDDPHRIVVDRAQLAGQSPLGSLPTVDGDDVAYVIFTSGSTGTPRGVPVSHRQLAASTSARAGVYEQEAGRFLVVSSLAFDSSIAGLFWALVDGGTVVFPTDDDVHDPDRLIALFAEQGISNTLMVPSLYQALLTRADANVRWPEQIIVAGEACPPALVAAHFERRPDVALTNEYGPTEATVWASAHHCRPGDDPVPIGGAIPGTWLAVVDEAGVHRPQGVSGELLIGGAGVVDGYFRDERRTAERFGSGEKGRYFRTGDRAVIRGGTVHFLGRIDDQLNVGGVRAEPEDIERVLNAEPTVGATVVTAIDPRSLDDLANTTDKALIAAAMREAANDTDPTQRLIRGLRTMDSTRLRLVAFVEPVDESLTVDTEAVRTHAANHLPPLLRPSLISAVLRLPRTPNGKVDRQAALTLPITSPTVPRPAVGESVDGIDEQVAALFAEVLQLPTLGLDESFFDAGGHSLLAMDLLLRLETEVAVEVTVSTLYERPTPREVANFVRELGPARAQNRFLVPIQPNGTRPPIFGIHVLGPNADFYRPLAERLGPDQPIWGLGLPTRTPDTSGPTEVEAVAGRYADELEGCAPTGPVTLAAVSLGSVVAFELAHQLRARGREVALLALFDAAGPGASDLSLTRAERVKVHGREFISDPTEYVRRRSARVRARLERQAEIAALKARERLRLPVPNELKVRAFVEANWAAQGAYDFKPYAAPIVIYKAGDDPFTRQLAAAGMGWADLATGPFKVTVVPGEHLSMLDEPHVETLALELATDHDEAMTTATTASDRPTRTTRDEMEATLIEALGEGRIGLDLARALERIGELEPAAAELVHRCDQVTKGLAGRAREQAAAAGEAIAGAGVMARIQPVPARLAHCTFGIRLDLTGTDRAGSLTAVLSALAPLGYRPQQRIEPGAVGQIVDDTDSLSLIHHDATIRLDLRWGTKTEGTLPDRSLTSVSADDGPDLGVFLGTPVSIVSDILAIAEPTSGELVTDLGCGDARVLIEAARHFGLRGNGIENDPRLVTLARSNVDANGLDDLIEITEADASTADLGETDIAFAFLPPRVIASILPDLLDRLAPGARLIAHEQLQVNWSVTPDRSTLIVGNDHLTVAHLWTSGR